MSNPVTDVANALVTELSTLISRYSGLVVQKMVWNPGKLPAFTQYCIIVAPGSEPWAERTLSVRTFQYKVRFELYLLIKNYDEVNSVFGDTAPNLGIFELVNDVKNLLRISRLGGILAGGFKSYEEPAGPLAFEYAASMGFDTSEHSHVRRARLHYEAMAKEISQPITPE
jgi:hypothetical protein